MSSLVSTSTMNVGLEEKPDGWYIFTEILGASGFVIGERRYKGPFPSKQTAKHHLDTAVIPSLDRLYDKH